MTSNETKPVRLRKRSEADGQALIEAARDNATAAHRATAGANDHGGREYWLHLDETVEVELRFGGRHPAIIAACWSHDVLEDCCVHLPMDERRERLRAVIDADSEAVVWSVTDREGYPNRRTRKEATLPFTALQKGGTDVKLDDRIANVEHALRLGNASMLKMYLKEQERFEQLLRRDGQCAAKWQHLRSLMMVSDAPAGEGDVVRSGRSYFDGRHLLAMGRACIKGEADEMFMPGPGVIRARIGTAIYEQGVRSNGKVSRSASERGSEGAAKVEYARQLPASIARWFSPVRVATTDGNGGGIPEGDARTIDHLMAGATGREAREIARIRTVIGAGQYSEDLDGGQRQFYMDNYSREGAREGVRRWARQHAGLAARADIAEQLAPMLTAGA